jgi:hypothetical protein
VGKYEGGERRCGRTEWTDVLTLSRSFGGRVGSPRLHEWQSEMTTLTGTSTQRRRPVQAWPAALACAASAVVLLVAAPGARADDESTKAFHPVDENQHSLIFRPRHLDSTRVVRA